MTMCKFCVSTVCNNQLPSCLILLNHFVALIVAGLCCLYHGRRHKYISKQFSYLVIHGVGAWYRLVSAQIAHNILAQPNPTCWCTDLPMGSFNFLCRLTWKYYINVAYLQIGRNKLATDTLQTTLLFRRRNRTFIFKFHWHLFPMLR